MWDIQTKYSEQKLIDSAEKKTCDSFGRNRRISNKVFEENWFI